MKILIISMGTRGDIEPFLAIGEILKNNGHEVICAFPEQFHKHTLESNLTFISLGSEFIKMVHSKEGKRVMDNEGSLLKKMINYYKFYKKHTDVRDIHLHLQLEIVKKVDPDRIIHSGLALYPFIWECQNRYKTTLVIPVPFIVYPVKDNAHIIFNNNWGPYLNKLTYKVTNIYLSLGIKNAAKVLQIPFDHSRVKIARSLLSHKTIFTVSPALFPRPGYWTKTATVLGFHERSKINRWTPSPELEHFIDQHERLLFITFGSMTTSFPKENTQIILNTLEENNIPAIINTASGGLIKPLDYNSKLFYFVSEIPYDWILPKIYGIVHHGGSGTTHAGLKYGCATLVIPHIFDQFTWNKIIAKKGLGPLGIKISKISESNLGPRMLKLFTNPSFKRKAEEISNQMKMENFDDQLCQFIINDQL